MTPVDAGTLLLLGALWGASFLFIRVAAPAFGPLPLVLARVALAGLLLALARAAGRRRPPARERARRVLGLGALNAAIPFSLIAFAQLELPASVGAVLNATTPLFAALASAVVLRDPIRPRVLGGLLLGLAGVALVVGFRPGPLTPEGLLAAAASLLAAFFYAAGSLYTKRTFAGRSPLDVALLQQVGAGTLLAAPAVATLPGAWPSPVAWGSALALGGPCTALAYLLFFRLIERVGPTVTMTVTFLVPLFGMAWGALLLDEAVTGGMLAGAAAVLASLPLVAPPRRGSVAARPARPLRPPAG